MIGMREILFRGKRYMDDAWVDGSLFIDEKKEKHEILLGYVNYRVGWEVIPETVGQFTGLTDKNGKKIFEGDIVRYFQRLLGGVDYEHKDPVLFLEGGFTVGVYFLNNWIRDASNGNIQLEGIEVIGNIHDNPELLGVW